MHLMLELKRDKALKQNEQSMKKTTIIKVLDLTIIVLFIIVLIIAFREYQRLSRITCLGLQAPPKYFVISSLIPAVGLLIQLPSLLILIRYIIKNKK